MTFIPDAVSRMAALGRAGLTISVCCGPCGAQAFRWTVQVLSCDGQEFAHPFAADSFVDAIAIAEVECERRGWLSPRQLAALWRAER